MLSPIEQVLLNRGIDLEDQEKWIDAGWESINDCWLLDNMELAVKKVHTAIVGLLPTIVIQDCDVDGITSSSIFLNYVNKVANDLVGCEHYVEDCVTVLLHDGKQHGLADLINEIPKGTKFLVIPDAASNDVEQCEELSKRMDIVILDHHVASKNAYATVVNPQLDNYPNKALTGAGVVWQFCRAYDETYDFHYANDFIDLAALGECGDMADYRETEVRAMVNLGLYIPKNEGYNKIRNKFLKAILEKNDYISQKRNGVNYLSIAFSCVSWINACCRSGTMEEKRLILDAFLEYKQDSFTQSSKRGEGGKPVPLVEEAVTVLGRVKRRQSNIQDEALSFFTDQIAEQGLADNAIIVCTCGEDVSPAILGLIANKIQAEYQHPALVLRQVEQEDGIHLSGSARNYSLCEIEDMRKICEDTGMVDYAQGHDSAFGFSILKGNLDGFIQKTNEVYKDVDFTPVYHVDYVWGQGDTSMAKIVLSIADLDIYGQNIPESQVCVEGIDLSQCNIQLLSPDKHPTIKVQLPCGVALLKFGSSKEEFERFTFGREKLTVIGTCAKNEWNGNITPQIQVKDYELSETEEEDEVWVF